MQHVLELEVPDITRNVCHKLKGNYARLSIQKAGSHVVEKCLLSSERDCIIRELVNSDKLDQLARDRSIKIVGSYAAITTSSQIILIRDLVGL